MVVRLSQGAISRTITPSRHLGTCMSFMVPGRQFQRRNLSNKSQRPAWPCWAARRGAISKKGHHEMDLRAAVWTNCCVRGC